MPKERRMISHAGPPLSTGGSPCEFAQNLHAWWKISFKSTGFDLKFQEQNQRNIDMTKFHHFSSLLGFPNWMATW